MGIHYFWREHPPNTGTGLLILGQHYMIVKQLFVAARAPQHDTHGENHLQDKDVHTHFRFLWETYKVRSPCFAAIAQKRHHSSRASWLPPAAR